jgi:TolA-binding protein
MSFCRRWLLILSALVLGGGQLFAATREQRAYAAAVASFQEEIWDRAETQLAQFVKNYRTSTNAPMAVLLQAQAEFKQAKFSDAVALLAANQPSAGPLADQYVRWTGEAQFADGDFSAAAATFTKLAENFPDSPLALGAVVEAAAANEKLGEPGWLRLDEQLSATNGIFARTARLDPDNEQVAAGRLLLAQSKFLRNDYAGADAVLSLLNPPTLKPAQDHQRLQLLGRVKTALKDIDAALAATTNLMQLARLQKNADWLAEGVAAQATLLENKNLLPEADLVWRQNLTNAPAERQQEAVLKIVALAAAQKNFTNAAALLDGFVGQFSNAPAAELARLTAGELNLQEYAARPAATNQLALAREKFDLLLGADTNSPLAGRAFLGRGWCRWLTGKTNDSLADFEQAAQKLPPSEELAVAKFKAGDARFALDDFSGATSFYQAVLNDFGNFPAVAKSLGDRALYQILRADLKLNDLAGAEAAMRRLLEKFPASELADDSLLLLGEAFSDFRQPDNAFRVFADFEKLCPDSPLRPRVEFAAARTFEGESNWPVAVTNYEAWLNNFPTNELRPQVKFALAQAHFHAGDEAGAFALFTGFVAEFPTNAELAPLAQWWVADHFFRATNFAGVENYFAAETNYENIFQNPAWRNSTNLFFQAQLMAGRAAMARLGFSDAAGYLAKLLEFTNCPDAVKLPARFAYAHALMQSEVADTNKLAANFQSAISVFDQVRQFCPTNEWAARAWSEIGECYFQLGDLDAATNAYAQAIVSPAAGDGLRSRARVRLGMALEKKAELLPPAGRETLLKMARDSYLDVLDDDAADPFWAKKAGWQVLPLILTLKDGRADEFFKNLEFRLPQLKDSLEKKRAALDAGKN